MNENEMNEMNLNAKEIGRIKNILAATQKVKPEQIKIGTIEENFTFNSPSIKVWFTVNDRTEMDCSMIETRMFRW